MKADSLSFSIRNELHSRSNFSNVLLSRLFSSIAQFKSQKVIRNLVELPFIFNIIDNKHLVIEIHIYHVFEVLVEEIVLVGRRVNQLGDPLNFSMK
jgi:hypothetical protein